MRFRQASKILKKSKLISEIDSFVYVDRRWVRLMPVQRWIVAYRKTLKAGDNRRKSKAGK